MNKAELSHAIGGLEVVSIQTMQLIAQAYLVTHRTRTPTEKTVKVMLTNPEPQPAGDSFLTFNRISLTVQDSIFQIQDRIGRYTVCTVYYLFSPVFCLEIIPFQTMLKRINARIDITGAE